MRLIILMGPVASALGGIAISAILEWSLDQFWTLLPGNNEVKGSSSSAAAAAADKPAKGKGGGKSPGSMPVGAKSVALRRLKCPKLFSPKRWAWA